MSSTTPGARKNQIGTFFFRRHTHEWQPTPIEWSTSRPPALPPAWLNRRRAPRNPPREAFRLLIECGKILLQVAQTRPKKPRCGHAHSVSWVDRRWPHRVSPTGCVTLTGPSNYPRPHQAPVHPVSTASPFLPPRGRSTDWWAITILACPAQKQNMAGAGFSPYSEHAGQLGEDPICKIEVPVPTLVP